LKLVEAGAREEVFIANTVLVTSSKIKSLRFCEGITTKNTIYKTHTSSPTGAGLTTN
jgi:hypothetical protein